MPEQSTGVEGRSHGDQPCWFCANAVPRLGNPCPWAMRFKPVPGWEARPDELPASGKFKPVPTYEILKCPLYDPG